MFIEWIFIVISLFFFTFAALVYNKKAVQFLFAKQIPMYIGEHYYKLNSFILFTMGTVTLCFSFFATTLSIFIWIVPILLLRLLQVFFHQRAVHSLFLAKK